jgi:hypothetical protein
LKAKTHRFWFALNGINSNNTKPSEEIPIYIYYQYGTDSPRKKRIPSIKVPFVNWDTKTKYFKKNAVNKNLIHNEDLEYIDEIKSKFRPLARRLAEGEITVENAFKALLKQQEDGTVRTHLLQEKGIAYPYDTANKYIDYLNGVEKHLPNTFIPLLFSHIQDLNSVKEIAAKLKTADVSSNTARDYLRALDVITDRANLSVSKPFKAQKLIPAKQESRKKNTTYIDLLQAINKINTKQDYLSYAFWLLSFSLRGLDGNDICNISEDSVAGDFRLPYYPDWDSDNCFINCGEKAYLIKRRGKSNKFYSILLNLYPTYYLHRLVKQLIKETHPEYAYKGSDKLRLFNFTTKDKHNNGIEEGQTKWKNIRDTISKKAVKLTGEGIKTARHTFNRLADTALYLSDSQQRDLLQHSTGKALEHYQSPQQINTDLNHIFILQEYEIAKICELLLQKGEREGYHNFNMTNGSKTLLKKHKLTTFTQEEEREYQKLLSEYESKPLSSFDENGKLILTKAPKAKRLIELEKKRLSDYRKANPIGDVYLDAPEHECNYMLKQSEKEGIQIWEDKYNAYLEKMDMKLA